MKIFVCNRSNELESTTSLVNELNIMAMNSIIFTQEIDHSNKWKEKVTKKMEDADFILFILGNNIFESENLKWELNKAEELNKNIIGLKSSTFTGNTINNFGNNYVFGNVLQCFNYLQNKYKEKQLLLVEQYKMMVISTEKVTEQRSKVNNLFLTITASLLSITFVIGKSLEFSIIAIIVMLFFTILTLIVTYSWEKLVKSYGDLNKGKFLIIDKIEKQLTINMFKDEWEILTKRIKYKPNSQTEKSIVIYFRWFIFITAIFEFIYFLILLQK